ncbi:MAG: hypothetical protein ACLVIZ_05165 [Bifidobacterium pseudocatenulatum]
MNIKASCSPAEYDERLSYLRKSGKGEATAGDITRRPASLSPTRICISHLAEDGELEIEFTVERGRGYVPAQMNKQDNAEIGRIPVDSIYSRCQGELSRKPFEQRTDSTSHPGRGDQVGTRVMLSHPQAPLVELFARAASSNPG